MMDPLRLAPEEPAHPHSRRVLLRSLTPWVFSHLSELIILLYFHWSLSRPSSSSDVSVKESMVPFERLVDDESPCPLARLTTHSLNDEDHDFLGPDFGAAEE